MLRLTLYHYFCTQSCYFPKGDNSKQIKLTILDDTTPEVNEEYQVHLLNIRTEGWYDSNNLVFNVWSVERGK
jgi:hypothetical protein